jgi:hypothetical protein
MPLAGHRARQRDRGGVVRGGQRNGAGVGRLGLGGHQLRHQGALPVRGAALQQSQLLRHHNRWTAAPPLQLLLVPRRARAGRPLHVQRCKGPGSHWLQGRAPAIQALRRCYPSLAAAGYNYSLNTCARSYGQAEAACRLQGGHLASYGSQAEQVEVEGYSLSQGLLVGGYGGYWMGAKVRGACVEPRTLHAAPASWYALPCPAHRQADATRHMVPQGSAWRPWGCLQVKNGSFAWLDFALQSPYDPAGYQAWGSHLPDNSTQPTAAHGCLVANSSESAQGVWGWSPANCSAPMVSMCKIIGAGRGQAAAPQCAPLPCTARRQHAVVHARCRPPAMPSPRQRTHRPQNTCLDLPLPAPLPAANNLYPPIYFTTLATTDVTYVLAKAHMDQQGAQVRCNHLGGHLAAFTSREEQRELETGLQDSVGASSPAPLAPPTQRPLQLLRVVAGGRSRLMSFSADPAHPAQAFPCPLTPGLPDPRVPGHLLDGPAHHSPAVARLHLDRPHHRPNHLARRVATTVAHPCACPSLWIPRAA